MLDLNDLPTEILDQIARYVEVKRDHDGRPPRALPKHLFTCKHWFEAALPRYLSNVNPFLLFLSSQDLLNLPPDDSPILNLVASRVERFSLRLIGQPSDDTAYAPFFLAGEEVTSDEDEDEDADEDEDYDPDNESSKESSSAGDSADDDDDALNAHDDLDADDAEDALDEDEEDVWFDNKPWAKDVAIRMPRLSKFLNDCTNLEEVSVQAYYGCGDKLLEQQDYLDFEATKFFVLDLPLNLKFLTLDLAGSNIYPSSEHLCPVIHQCLLNVEHVRLRLRYVCPAVLGVAAMRPHQVRDSQQQRRGQQNQRRGASSGRSRNRRGRVRLPFRTRTHTNGVRQEIEYVGNDNPVGPSRLKDLIIRLNLPYFPDAQESHDGLTFDAALCRHFPADEEFGLSKLLTLAAKHFLSQQPDVENLKVSRRDSQPGGTNLYAIDCVSWQLQYSIDEEFCYEDDGDQWDDWENRVDINQPIPTPDELSQMALDCNYVGTYKQARRPPIASTSSGPASEEAFGSAEQVAMMALAQSMFPEEFATALEEVIGDQDLMEPNTSGSDHDDQPGTN